MGRAAAGRSLALYQTVSKAKVQEQMQQFFDGLPARTAEVRSRCRRTLQALAEAALEPAPEAHRQGPHVDLIGA